MMSKRGQITIFIIIGIVIVFSVGFYLFLKAGGSFGAVAPEQVHPVKAFVQSCLDNLGEEGISKIGNTGGFITYPQEIDRNKRAYIPTGLDEVKIPLWFHDGRSRIPSQAFIESQLDAYINQNLNSCLGDFETYRSQFNIEPQGPAQASSEMIDAGVSITLDYPLKIENKDGTESFTIDDYNVIIPVRLKRAYDLAREIFERQLGQGFLENTVNDLIVLDEDIPDTDMVFSCTPQTWRLSEIKAKLQRLVVANFPFIKLAGTRTTPFPDEYPYLKTHYLWEYSEKQFTDMRVSVKYNDDWPFTLAARPSSNGVMSSSPLQSSGLLSAFCTQIVHFTYDAKFPVMFTMVDDAAKTHEQFVFNFGMMVDMDHNLPNRQSAGISFFEPVATTSNNEFCERVSKELTLNLWNNVSGFSDVIDANITLICGRYVCDLGTSDWISGQTAGIQKRVPSCSNAILQASKDNFETAQKFASTEVQKVVDLYMIPTKTINKISVLKHRSNVPEIERQLGVSEQVLITVSQENSTLSSFAVYPSEAPQQIKLLAGQDFTYDVSINLVRGDQIVGGYIGKWNALWTQLQNANEIEFHVIEQYPPPSDDLERGEFIDNLEEYSKNISAPVIR